MSYEPTENYDFSCGYFYFLNEAKDSFHQMNSNMSFNPSQNELTPIQVNACFQGDSLNFKDEIGEQEIANSTIQTQENSLNSIDNPPQPKNNINLNKCNKSLQKKKYKSFTYGEKKKILDSINNHSIPHISKLYSVSVKTIKRWLVKGIDNIRTGRIVRDKKMEIQLYSWYLDYHIKNKNPVSSKDIKAKAKEFSTEKCFLASKGWLEKFKNRNKLKLTRAKRVSMKKREEKIINN